MDKNKKGAEYYSAPFLFVKLLNFMPLLSKPPQP